MGGGAIGIVVERTVVSCPKEALPDEDGTHE